MYLLIFKVMKDGHDHGSRWQDLGHDLGTKRQDLASVMPKILGQDAVEIGC